MVTSSSGATWMFINKMRRIVSTFLIALVLILWQPTITSAAEIKVWTARAFAIVLTEIGPQFERETGHKLIVHSGLPADFNRRRDAGESFDVFISVSTPVDDWIKNGRIVAKTRTDLARSGVGVAVRTGARKPDIATVEAFKRALLDAKTVAFLKVGSGLYMDDLLDRMDLANAVRPKTTRPDTDIVCELVAKGEVELGIVVTTQIMTTAGVELAGPLPPEIQSHISFAAGIGSRSKKPKAARALIKFLQSPAAVRVIKSYGMEPLFAR